MELQDRIFSSMTIVWFGLSAVAVPLWFLGTWIVGGGLGVGSLSVETVLLLALASVVASAGYWLHRRDWDRAYEQIVATWTLFGTVLTAAVFGWLLVVQWIYGSQPEPAVIVADAVLLGTIGAFVAGVYRARDALRRDTLQQERDRFSALFESTTDCILGIDIEGESATVEAVNAAFTATFDVDGVDTASLSTGVPDDDDRTDALVESLESERHFETEMRRETATGVRDFLVQTVPIESTGRLDGYVIFTDITEQKRRERQLNWLNQASRGMTLAETVEEIADIVAEVASHSFERGVAAVFSRDTDSRSLEPVGADTNADAIDPIDTADLSAIDPGSSVIDSIESDHSGGIEEYDAEAISTGSMLPFPRAVVSPIDGDTLLVVWTPERGLDSISQTQLGTLSRSAGVALKALRNRTDLERRNRQLELLNSLLRHEIQNAITVIRSRAEHLLETAPESDAELAATIYERSDDIDTLVDRFRRMLDALEDERPTSTLDVAAIVHDRVAAFRAVHPTVDVECVAPETCEAVADETFSVVLDNLLNNAVEHNDADTPLVSVELTADGESITLVVEDNGSGVPEDYRSTVFERGETADGEAGSGFGLFFVQSMVERFGGSISLHDGTTGGARFVMQLPRSVDGPR